MNYHYCSDNHRKEHKHEQTRTIEIDSVSSEAMQVGED